jgi:hypothetical protein
LRETFASAEEFELVTVFLEEPHIAEQWHAYRETHLAEEMASADASDHWHEWLNQHLA